MANCVICNKSISDGPFNLKDKFELFGHTYICKVCAEKIGIKSIWSANTYTAEKARKKYFELFPNEINQKRQNTTSNSQSHTATLNTTRNSKSITGTKTIDTSKDELVNKAMEAIKTAQMPNNINKVDSEMIVPSKASNTADSFVEKIKQIPHVDTTWTTKEIRYLETILKPGEEVLHVVSGLMSQNEVSISGNRKELMGSGSSNTATWLMALTDQRIILLNRHFLIGTEQIEIPLTSVNSIARQSRILFSSISIMHGSGGIIIDNVSKGCDKAFVDKANNAIEEAKNASTNRIVSAIENSYRNYSPADELKKYKELLDIGAITPAEFNAKKKQLLNL